MKLLKVSTLNLSLLILFSSAMFSFSAQRHIKLLNADNIVSLAMSSKDQSVIYTASQDSIYKSEDNGKNWQKVYHISKANKKINRLFLDPESTDVIYIATQDGLYQGKKEGSAWRRIFMGSSDLEKNCLCVVKSTKGLYLGTTQGLFISYNEGKEWHKSFGQFSDSIITSIIVNPNEEDIIYLACEKGVFITEDNGKNWKRIYVVYRSEIPTEDYNDYDGDISDQILNIKAMAISSVKPNRLYVATPQGILFSDNKGDKWEKLTNLGLSSLNIQSMAVLFDRDELFVATDKGIFKLNGNSWLQITDGLSFNDLGFDRNGLLWLAGKGGIYVVDNYGSNKQENIQKVAETRKLDMDSLFSEEPNIKDVQKVAIEYADVNINKINNWRRQARLKALFPTISVGYDKNVYGSSTGAMAVGPRGWDIDFSWNVADLIWSSDQTSIDSRSRLTVQLRQDILDQVTRLYYERKRIKAELLLSSSKTEEEKLYKTLELQEITANLDGLTNGYFSKFLKQE